MWSAAANSMLAYAALLRAEPAEAERLSSQDARDGSGDHSPNLRLGLQTIHGAALFDSGETVGGLAEMRQARLEFGDLRRSRNRSPWPPCSSTARHCGSDTP